MKNQIYLFIILILAPASRVHAINYSFWFHFANDTNSNIEVPITKYVITWKGRLHSQIDKKVVQEIIKPYDVRFIQLDTSWYKENTVLDFKALDGNAKDYSVKYYTEGKPRTRAFIITPAGKKFTVTERSAQEAEKIAIR